MFNGLDRLACSNWQHVRLTPNRSSRTQVLRSPTKPRRIEWFSKRKLPSVLAVNYAVYSTMLQLMFADAEEPTQ